MIGASDRPDRPSYRRDGLLQSRGYRVLPVNPQITGEHVHGEYVWRELAQIGEPIDMVDIFRRPQAAGEAVDEAIAAGAKAVWLQIGVINEEAAARAEAAGPQGGDGPLPGDRDPAARRAANRSVTMSPDPETVLASAARHLPRLAGSGRAHSRTARPVFHIEKGKFFAYFWHNHHDDGITAVHVKTSGLDEQAMLIEADPETYYRPPYLGPSGWVGIRLDIGRDRLGPGRGPRRL